jgi:putative hemolysin
VTFGFLSQHSLLNTIFKEDAMFHTFSKLALAFCAATMLVGCASTPVPQPTGAPEPGGQLANPASENCVEQGGTVVIQKRGDGGEYGVCQFEDNRQCEEWALLRGECPAGGIKITGYVTMAAQFCAITGGTYEVTGNSNTDQEQGTCTFKNGKTCDAADYFAGQCDPDAETG